MDLGKLQTLACLDLSEEDMTKIEQDIGQVVLMLKTIEGVFVVDCACEKKLTEYRGADAKSQKIDVNSGLPLVDGVFLAPKVITKD